MALSSYTEVTFCLLFFFLSLEITSKNLLLTGAWETHLSIAINAMLRQNKILLLIVKLFWYIRKSNSKLLYKWRFKLANVSYCEIHELKTKMQYKQFLSKLTSPGHFFLSFQISPFFLLSTLKTIQQTDLLYFQLCCTNNTGKQFPQFDTSFLLFPFC